MRASGTLIDAQCHCVSHFSSTILKKENKERDKSLVNYGRKEERKKA